MIKGIGIDIIELSRVRNLITRQSKFVDRILTMNERISLKTFLKRERWNF